MSTPDFEEQVKQTLANVTTGDDGKTVWPDDTPTEVLFAARSEKRYRDTQSGFTKGQQELKILQEKNSRLVGHLEEIATVSLSPEQKTELDEMKFSDPEGWRTKMNLLETEAKGKLSEVVQNIDAESGKVGELEARTQTLAQFRVDNPELALTDEVIDNDIPPRITKKLADGKCSFDEFLGECKTYLGKGKVISTDTPTDDVNLSDLPGSDTPSDTAKAGDIVESYKNELY